MKFTNCWNTSRPSGFGLLFTHPAYSFYSPLRTVTGPVRADSHENFIHVPALWTNPEFSGTLSRGAPVTQCCLAAFQEVEMELTTIEGEAERRIQ